MAASVRQVVYKRNSKIFLPLNNYLHRRTSQKLRGDQTALDDSILRTRMKGPIAPTLSHWMDWSITRYGFSGDIKQQPDMIFVKGDPIRLAVFFKDYLPLVHKTTRFILVTGDADGTVPNQVDRRAPSHAENGLQAPIRTLLNDDRLIHWYAENLDEVHPKMSPVPLGYIGSNGDKLYRALLSGDVTSIRQKKLKVFCAHRVRDGEQWRKRKAVTQLATNQWTEFVDYFESIPGDRFLDTLKTYPFVLCVGGGGLDPSPKAWVTLLAGSIPIVERNPTTQGYEELPVILVDEWSEGALTQEKLSEWLEQLAPYFEDPIKRQRVLKRMSMGHWYRKIARHYDEAIAHQL